MRWTKFTLDTRRQAVDFISLILSDIGIEGIEISDKKQITEEEKKQMFIDILPDLGEDDGSASVTFYIDSILAEDIEDVQLKVQNALRDLSKTVDVGSGRLHISQTEDKDWINNWKKFFKPFRVDETIVIKPTWTDLPESKEDDIILEIDPGISFGTGGHETTKLAMLALKKHLKRDDIVLDAGSGSGILSILAMKLGAKEVLGIDIDSNATRSAMDNARVNNLDSYESLRFVTGNIIEDEDIRKKLGKNKYHIIVANILADVIIPMSSFIGEYLKEGGYFISSGIINTKEQEVKEALEENNFKVIEINRIKDWVSFVAQK